MRALCAAVLAMLMLAAAGCGDDTEVEVVWGGPPDPGAGASSR
jgi:hypothetical protein